MTEVKFNVELRGYDELMNRLKELDDVAGPKVMRSAMMGVPSKIILDRAKATVPRRSGALALAQSRSFHSESASFLGLTTGGRYVVRIGPKVRNRTAIALYNLYYHLVRGAHRGIYHGIYVEQRTGYLSNALQSSANQVVAALRDTLLRRIKRALRKQ